MRGTLSGLATKKLMGRACPNAFSLSLSNIVRIVGGDLKIIAAIEEPAVIVRILTPLGYRSNDRSAAKNGSATGPTIRLGSHSREALKLRRSAPLPDDAGFE